MNRKAFTLIELLVVIAIIAILAAILFPVFAQAKQAAKKSADLSNTKQIGIGLQLYLQDSDDVYMPSNHRINNDGNFEVHWSWMVLPYMKNEQIFVSPSDPIGGWAPSHWNTTNNNRGFGIPGVQTDGTSAYPGKITTQVGRISYLANQSVIGRKRRDADTATVVPATMIDGVSSTILLSATTDSKNCMRGTDGEYRTYRPAFGIAGRGQIAVSGSDIVVADQPYEAITKATRDAIWACEKSNDPGATPAHTLRFANSGRYDEGNNYVMADTSAKFHRTDATFSVSRYLWGKQVYSLGGTAVIDPVTGQPVQ